jgi:hypothetical protein
VLCAERIATDCHTAVGGDDGTESRALAGQPGCGACYVRSRKELRVMSMRTIHIPAFVLLIGTASCGGGSEQPANEGCAPYCRACPSDVFGTADCDSFCGGWTELGQVSSCEAQWQAGWTCIEEAGGCIEHEVCTGGDGGPISCSSSLLGECEPPGDSFSNCVEAYCRDHEAECQAITTAHGIPW